MDAHVKQRIGLHDAPDEALIAKYVALRDNRSQRKAAYENEDADDKRKMEKIESELLRRFNERGTDSTSSRKYGTAYRMTRTSCKASDWEMFFEQFVRPQEAWDFIDRRPNKKMIEAYKDEHNDLPPGIDWVEIASIGVKRG